MSNMKGVIFGPETSVISGPWGSYVRLDIRLRGNSGNMDGSDMMNDDRRESSMIAGFTMCTDRFASQRMEEEALCTR